MKIRASINKSISLVLVAGSLLWVVLLGSCVLSAQSGPATYKFRVVHEFKGGTSDAGWPRGNLISDGHGDLYSVTSWGGVLNSNCPQGCGTVFELNASGKEKLLHKFGLKAGAGLIPWGGLVRDKSGNLYGTTEEGGSFKGVCGNETGCGTVFRLDESGKETALHAFTGSPDGNSPGSGDMVRDENGNLYGTTWQGGSTQGWCGQGGLSWDGCGTVFAVDDNGKETVLYSFTGAADGAWPTGGLVQDSSGNLYGTTVTGGNGNPGCQQYNCSGTVFKIDKKGIETVLYAFTGGQDGANPSYASLSIDPTTGDLYGTTLYGGEMSACGGTGCGTVFKVDKNGKETVLHAFMGGEDGSVDYAGVIRDSSGNLYGATTNGGSYLLGNIFKLDKNGKLSVLYSFTGGQDGEYPSQSLFRDAKGNLYGTAAGGGSYQNCNGGCGTVFELMPR